MFGATPYDGTRRLAGRKVTSFYLNTIWERRSLTPVGESGKMLVAARDDPAPPACSTKQCFRRLARRYGAAPPPPRRAIAPLFVFFSHVVVSASRLCRKRLAHSGCGFSIITLAWNSDIVFVVDRMGLGAEDPTPGVARATLGHKVA